MESHIGAFRTAKSVYSSSRTPAERRSDTPFYCSIMTQHSLHLRSSGTSPATSSPGWKTRFSCQNFIFWCQTKWPDCCWRWAVCFHKRRLFLVRIGQQVRISARSEVGLDHVFRRKGCPRSVANRKWPEWHHSNERQEISHCCILVRGSHQGL